MKIKPHLKKKKKGKNPSNKIQQVLPGEETNTKITMI